MSVIDPWNLCQDLLRARIENDHIICPGMGNEQLFGIWIQALLVKSWQSACTSGTFASVCSEEVEGVGVEDVIRKTINDAITATTKTTSRAISSQAILRFHVSRGLLSTGIEYCPAICLSFFTHGPGTNFHS